MDRKAPAGRGYARYYCLGRKNGASECPGVAEAVLLDCLLASIAQLEQTAFNPDVDAERTRAEILAAQAKLAELGIRANKVLDSLEESGHSTLILGRLKIIEEEQAATEALLAQAKVSLASTPLLDHSFGQKLAERTAAVIADKGDSAGRQKVAQTLRQVVVRICWDGSLFTINGRSGATFFVNPPAEVLARARNRNAGHPRSKKEIS